jgi:hypothetical protein
MVCPDEVRQEVEFLSERIQQLRRLQQSQKQLVLITAHLQGHIDKLEERLREVELKRLAS